MTKESDLEKLLEKLLDKKLSQMMEEKLPGAVKYASKKKVERPTGPFLKSLIEASERIPSGTRRQGIRFKLGADHMETSIETGLKEEVEEILREKGMTISRACHAALVLILEEARGK